MCEVCGGDQSQGEPGTGRTPGVWEAVAWKPTWTVECPECRGTGRHGVGVLSHDYPCQVCAPELPRDQYGRGSGRVPRPMPATAMPLTRLVLTTWPNIDVPTDAGFKLESRSPSHAPNEIVWSNPRWPGIDFVMIIPPYNQEGP